MGAFGLGKCVCMSSLSRGCQREGCGDSRRPLLLATSLHNIRSMPSGFKESHFFFVPSSSNLHVPYKTVQLLRFLTQSRDFGLVAQRTPYSNRELKANSQASQPA